MPNNTLRAGIQEFALQVWFKLWQYLNLVYDQILEILREKKTHKDQPAVGFSLPPPPLQGYAKTGSRPRRLKSLIIFPSVTLGHNLTFKHTFITFSLLNSFDDACVLNEKSIKRQFCKSRIGMTRQTEQIWIRIKTKWIP